MQRSVRSSSPTSIVIALLLSGVSPTTTAPSIAGNPITRKPTDPPEIDIKGSRFSLAPENAAGKDPRSATENTPAAEPAAPARRLPLPEAAAQKRGDGSRSLQVRLEKAKLPAEQVALAEKLMKTAAETKDDPVAQFVLWQLAIELATKSGEPVTAFSALDEVAKNFEIDELAVKSRTFVGLARGSRRKTFAKRSSWHLV